MFYSAKLSLYSGNAKCLSPGSAHCVHVNHGLMRRSKTLEEIKKSDLLLTRSRSDFLFHSVPVHCTTDKSFLDKATQHIQAKNLALTELRIRILVIKSRGAVSLCRISYLDFSLREQK